MTEKDVLKLISEYWNYENKRKIINSKLRRIIKKINYLKNKIDEYKPRRKKPIMDTSGYTLAGKSRKDGSRIAIFDSSLK